MSRQIIEVDQNAVGDDYNDGFDSDTASLASNMFSHVFENGRRFHGWHEGRYAMPNDEEEQKRMQIQHHICLLALRGKLFASPDVTNPQRILDVGAGCGIWAIDAGDVYPEAQVIGVDLSPIQPKWVPPNVTFEVDDIEQEWLYADNSFDFIHIRQLTGFIDDWPKLYKQAFRALKPGGTIEIADLMDFFCDDGTLPDDSMMVKWPIAWHLGISKVGRISSVEEHAPTLSELGFEGVTYDFIKIAVGTWPKDYAQKELGYYMREHLYDGCESISLAVFTRFLGWRKEDVDSFLADVRKDLMNKSYHAYTALHITYAKKPLDP